MRAPRCSWLLPALMLSGCAPFQPWFDHGANDPLIQYTGRMDFSGEGPTFSLPGASIRFRFDGAGLELIFSDRGAGGPQHTNYVQVFLDGKPLKQLELRHDVNFYEVFRDIEPGIHTVEIVKRTDSLAGATQFLGMTLQGELLEPPPRPQRKLEFIGDAITCGYGNAVSIDAPQGTEANTGYHSVNQDITQAYGNVAARLLEAEVVTFCRAGTGIYRNIDGTTEGTLPSRYGRIFLGEETPVWDFQRYVPDTVVLNLGTSDFSVSGADGQPTVPPADAFKSAYAGFLRQLRELYPAARLVCVVGPTMSDNLPPGSNRWTLLQQYVRETVDQVRAQGDARVHFLALTPATSGPFGEDWHPTTATHARMAQELVSFLRGLEGT